MNGTILHFVVNAIDYLPFMGVWSTRRLEINISFNRYGLRHVFFVLRACMSIIYLDINIYVHYEVDGNENMKIMQTNGLWLQVFLHWMEE